jgi:hypothetical protein
MRYQIFRDLLGLFRRAAEQMSTSDASFLVRQRGRPPDCPHEIVMRIIELRLQGLSYGRHQHGVEQREDPHSGWPAGLG